MGTKIYHPISPEAKDQTGLYLCGRHKDGRYQYRSEPVIGHASNIVSVTQEQRVGLAVCYALAKLVRPGTTTVIYPMTKHNRYEGFACGSAKLWLSPVLLHGIGVAYLDREKPKVADIRTHASGCGKADEALGVLAHEMGHNTQRGGKPHGPEFKAAHTQMRLAMKDALSRGWPKLDMRRLRDSVAPHLAAVAAKKKRKEVAASEPRASKWARTLDNAEKLLAIWKKRLAAAERKVAAWEKKVRHARRHLDRALSEREAA